MRPLALHRAPPPRLRPAAELASSELNAAVLALLSAAGFSGASSNAALLLAELLHRFLQLLARLSIHHALQANRAAPALPDAAAALDALLGPPALDDLLDWAHFEAVLSRPKPPPRPPAIAAQLHALAAHSSLSRKRPAPSPGPPTNPALAALEHLLDHAYVWGVPPPTPTRTTTLPYPRPPPLHHSPRPPLPLPLPPRPPPAAHALGPDGIRRLWRRRAQRYYGFLPDDPPRPTDLPAIHSPPPRRPPPSSLALFADELHDLLQDPASHVPVFLTSPAAIRANHSHIPASLHRDIAVKRRRLALSFADPLRYIPIDSLHGSVHVLPASPAAIPGPSLLITIPHSRDSRDSRDKDAPVPADAAPSDLPVFSPVHPHGRPVAFAPPSGALFPSLSYRHPSHLYSTLRILAFPPIQRLVSRIADPPALLDDHRTEQVYHGIPVSRDLLTGTITSVLHRNSSGLLIDRFRGANSYLHPALERLRFHLAALHARRRAALDGGAQLEQLDREPIRGERIRLPRSGTLVHTWDWRDVDIHADLAPPPAENAKISSLPDDPAQSTPETAPKTTPHTAPESTPAIAPEAPALSH
ncbi:hypothetical protein MCUN1_000002 [Malassezia cuniculi]|uniref:Bromodomain associated domain-containing protein n=1 Tax=Malassezia cuniculi TaxID=948313 RepID=A0AAF0EQV0_9BASI|nr:hypothetical protein MCUN1_000002 [Malassezia cuniculi]